MSGALTNLLLEIAKDVFVAGLAAWLTVRRALREFSSQRWWERQEEAYKRIIDGLSQIQIHLTRMNNMGAIFVSENEQLKHWSMVLKQVEVLEKIFHEGAFRISKASNIALKDLTTSWYPAPPLTEDGLSLQDYHDKVGRCRDVIDREARKDLGLPRQH